MRVFRLLPFAVVLGLVIVLVLGCFGGKRTRTSGTNLGSGSDHDGPWSEGGHSAAHPAP